jgi:hypothetical protein
METNFNNFKEEILRRAKEAKACVEEYQRAYRSDSFDDLMQVIKDNFNWVSLHRVIDPNIIEAYKDQFNANRIYCNVDVTEGYLLALGNSTVTARGNSTVTARDNSTVTLDNSTVTALDNSTVTALDNSTVTAWDNSTVTARGNSTVTSRYTIECKLSDNAIYRIQESNTVRYVSDNIKFEKVTFYGPEGAETKEELKRK